jgi:hypothetical protein
MLHRLRNAGLNPKLQTSGLRILVFSLLSASTASASATNPPATAVVRTSGMEFAMDGKMFFVTGVNNHHLTFGSHDEVTHVLDAAEAGAASRAAGIIAGLGLTAFSCVMTRFANTWVLATEMHRGEGNAQMDDTLSRGGASAGTAPPALPTKGVVE